MLVLVRSSSAAVVVAAAVTNTAVNYYTPCYRSLFFARYFGLFRFHPFKNLGKMGTRLTKHRSDSYDIPEQNPQQRRPMILNGDMTPPIVKVLCHEDDLENNQMKEFTVEGDAKILLIKDSGKFSAIGTKCTHYGAPLVGGVYCNGTVRCPWHGACFNAQTGDIEDFPGLDGLPSFQIEVENHQVKIRTRIGALHGTKHEKEMVQRDPSDPTAFVLLGAGAAGAKCAETLRQAGYAGRIVVVTKESHLPYDRPKLSKALEMTADKLALRSSDFYETHDIEVIKNKEVTSVNANSKLITFKDGSTIAYTKALVATGGVPRRLINVPGHDFENVVVLRSVNDANFLANNIKDKHVVVLGMSFIGMESASYFTGKAAKVTVVGSTAVPFLPVLLSTKLFEEKGVVFHRNESISAFKGEDRKLNEVILGNGTSIPADICLLGIGDSIFLLRLPNNSTTVAKFERAFQCSNSKQQWPTVSCQQRPAMST